MRFSFTVALVSLLATGSNAFAPMQSARPLSTVLSESAGSSDREAKEWTRQALSLVAGSALSVSVLLSSPQVSDAALFGGKPSAPPVETGAPAPAPKQFTPISDIISPSVYKTSTLTAPPAAGVVKKSAPATSTLTAPPAAGVVKKTAPAAPVAPASVQKTTTKAAAPTTTKAAAPAAAAVPKEKALLDKAKATLEATTKTAAATKKDLTAIRTADAKAKMSLKTIEANAKTAKSAYVAANDKLAALKKKKASASVIDKQKVIVGAYKHTLLL